MCVTSVDDVILRLSKVDLEMIFADVLLGKMLFRGNAIKGIFDCIT